MPIFLEIVRSEERTPIGITHFAKLLPDFDERSFDEVARTVDELAESIFQAVEIHRQAKRLGVNITPRGVAFFTDGPEIEFREGILFVNDRPVIHEGEPLVANLLCAEGKMVFKETGDGEIEFQNEVDQREGKGFFLKTDGESWTTVRK